MFRIEKAGEYVIHIYTYTHNARARTHVSVQYTVNSMYTCLNDPVEDRRDEGAAAKGDKAFT